MGAMNAENSEALLGDFTFGFVGGVVDFGVEAFEEAREEGVWSSLSFCRFVSVGDVTGEVGEDDAPGEGGLPRLRCEC